MLRRLKKTFYKPLETIKTIKHIDNEVSFFKRFIYYCFYFEKRKYITIHEHLKHNKRTVILYHKTEYLTYDNVNYYNAVDNFRQHKNIKKENYVLNMKNISIIGGSSVVLLDNDKVVYELKECDTNSNFLYTDKAIIDYCDDDFLIRKYLRVQKISAGINFIANYSWNYYHFMFEVLQKFFLLSKMNISKNIPILLDASAKDIKQYTELVEVFNIEKREIIYLQPGQSYQINDFYYLSNLNIVPPNFKSNIEIKASDCAYDLTSITYLRNMLLNLKSNIETPLKIFLSRKKASNRRAFNHNDVWELLRKKGFVEFFPEDYTITEQVAIFNNADYIVGGSGAAFTNILFCKQNSKIICLTNIQTQLSCFASIANIIGAKLYYISEAGRSYKETETLHSSYKINLEELNELLALL